MQNIKKRQELLRSFFYDIEIHDKNRLMEWLGISSSTYYKTLKEMTKLISRNNIPSNIELADYLRKTIKYNPFVQTTNLLATLYQTNKMRDLPRERFGIILKILQHYGEQSTNELIEKMTTHKLNEQSDYVFFTEREIMRYLNDLEEEGLIEKELKKGEKRLENFYRIRPFFQSFTLGELLELHSFILFGVHTEVPSAPGFTLLEKLNYYIENIHNESTNRLQDTVYQYPYFGRVLDEYIVYTLIEAMESRKSIFVYYQSVNSDQKQVLKNEGESKSSFLPLQIVFDYMYARWYVVGAYENQHEHSPLQRLRIDFISKIEFGKEIDEDQWNKWIHQAKEQLEKCWCISYKETLTKVKIRFTFHPDGGEENFIRKKVEEQGQWGKIIEEEGHSFIWEIDVYDTNELIPWIRSFGSSATVLEPISLREKVYQSWKEVLEQYEHHLQI